MSLPRLLLASALCLLAQSAAAAPPRTVFKLELDGVKLEGTSLAATASQMLLLDREGKLWDFHPDQARNVQATTTVFHAYPSGVVRSRLQAEFGKGYDVTGTGHYLVVHPAGQKDQWGQRFENLYRSFWHYFSVRGFKLTEPEFPLVAVVLPSRDDFQRYAHRTGTNASPGVIGYYSPQTNRVAMYDLGGGDGKQIGSENLATIIHEATHQTAFNTGIHNRFCQTPRWVAEGLGTLFEAPGVWNSRSNARYRDRLNPGRKADFDRLVAQRPADRLPQLISGDRLFQADPTAAYAEAWAFTHFLVETRPRDYSAYLAKTAARGNFTGYSAAQRQADFTAVFGQNLQLLDAQFVKFMRTGK
ncbi:MAG: DUF1570 domain-containing protein [Pirellulales bacterium]